MKHKVSELEGALLDAAVAKAEGYALDSDGDNLTVRQFSGAPSAWHPSTDWSHGGPIVERERISVQPNYARALEDGEVSGEWSSFPDVDKAQHCLYGPTPLIAAMRAYVASRFGEEVELS